MLVTLSFEIQFCAYAVCLGDWESLEDRDSASSRGNSSECLTQSLEKTKTKIVVCVRQRSMDFDHLHCLEETDLEMYIKASSTSI